MDQDCPGDLVCDQQRCAASTPAPAPAASGLACVRDMDCPGDEICNAKVCSLPAAPANATACGADRDCPGSLVCTAGACSAAGAGSALAPAAQAAAPEEARFWLRLGLGLGMYVLAFSEAPGLGGSSLGFMGLYSEAALSLGIKPSKIVALAATTAFMFQGSADSTEMVFGDQYVTLESGNGARIGADVNLFFGGGRIVGGVGYQSFGGPDLDAVAGLVLHGGGGGRIRLGEDWALEPMGDLAIMPNTDPSGTALFLLAQVGLTHE